MIGEKISGDSEHYCTKYNIVLLDDAAKEPPCRECDSRIVRKKVKA